MVAAPDYVPSDPTRRVRRYQSPPRRSGSWSASRPGDLPAGQPNGVRLGSQGPDQGYIYKLVPLLADELHLGGVSYEDAVSGAVALALKRAAHFGRAPVIHDLRMAYKIFGFLDVEAPVDLVELREGMFDQIANHHHYAERRAVADAVPVDVLSLSQTVIELNYESDWRKNLNL